MAQLFNEVVVSGTFDRLHKGHEQLLDTAIKNGKKVWCGLTTAQINRNKILADTIQPYSLREESLTDYLNWHKAKSRSLIFPLSDPFGPAIKTNHLEAIIATVENQPAVNKINELRRQKNLSPLTPILVDLSPADDRQKLSSTRIRLGEINRNGRVFSQIFKSKKLVLPSYQRHHFKKPLGQLRKNLGGINQEIQSQPTPLIITIGDIVTRSFLQASLPFSLAIIDYRSRRLPLHKNFHRSLLNQKLTTLKSTNPPGTISADLINKINTLLNKIIFAQEKCVLAVKGEEDLTVLPMVLLAPLASLVFYGQPNQGIVKIRVTEKIKEKTYQLLQRFNS